jgi:DNA helicase-2/ATP-dependent DNA helicase PcrA
MKFYCDLHVHSRFSRATSSRLGVRALALAAVDKGLSVIGTGDLTHPLWLDEIEAELVESEPGLFILRDGSCPTRFMLTGEVSTIYKQGGRVRKVHHVVCAPGLAEAKKMASSLARIGNVVSDGRPILGISSRDLLEIVLNSGHGSFLIPAHIWTPWFSVLGSKSGFDSIAECYLDLEPHVFAVETGLSSDPPMNWRVSDLDRYRLVSCSDAHSAEKLGREATVFDTELDYYAISRAMATGSGLMGTVEFFPEEGKYHLDGHSRCNVVLEPRRTRRSGPSAPPAAGRLPSECLTASRSSRTGTKGSFPNTRSPSAGSSRSRRSWPRSCRWPRPPAG